MPGKPNSRNWSDVQTAIATVAIVTTLGLWNLFATPPRTVKTAQTSEPVLPPPTEPPVVESSPTAMPQVKIIFTPGASQTIVTLPQVQQAQQTTRKKKRNNNGNNGGSVSITQTKTS